MLPTYKAIPDENRMEWLEPVAWQRDLHADRTLPGTE